MRGRGRVGIGLTPAVPAPVGEGGSTWVGVRSKDISSRKDFINMSLLLIVQFYDK